MVADDTQLGTTETRSCLDELLPSKCEDNAPHKSGKPRCEHNSHSDHRVGQPDAEDRVDHQRRWPRIARLQKKHRTGGREIDRSVVA